MTQLKKVLKGLFAGTGTALTAFASGLKGVFVAVSQFLLPITAIVVGFQSVITVIRSEWSRFISSVKEFGDSLPTIFKPLYLALGGWIIEAINLFNGASKQLTEDQQDLYNQIQKYSLTHFVAHDTSNWIENIRYYIESAINEAGKQISQGIGEIGTTIVNYIINIIQVINKLITGDLPAAWDQVKKIINIFPPA